MMPAAEFEWYARPAWIAATVLAFILWWPIGLAMLVFGCAARKMLRRAWYGYGGWSGGAPGQWYNTMHQGCGWGGWSRGRRGARWGGGNGPSGNQAFDDYRAETLRRLEEEQKEFSAFLERLRFARDKSEFDQFMAERRQPPAAPESPEPSAA